MKWILLYTFTWLASDVHTLEFGSEAHCKAAAQVIKTEWPTSRSVCLAKG
jgi:hypothetical protein